MMTNVVPIGDRPPIRGSGRNLALYSRSCDSACGSPASPAGNASPSFAHGGAQMKSILDPTFRYTSSANTDLRKTFARIRREARKQSQPENPEGTPKVTPIFRGQRPAA
jgi:hypothetical protein